MCFNSTTSLVTFSLSLLCFVYLLYNGITYGNNYDIFAAVVTILIGGMQLIEYFLWKNQNCSNTNHIASMLIVVLLYSQVVIESILFIYLFKGTSNLLNSFVLYVCIIYTFFTVYVLNWLKDKKLCSKPTKYSCRLAWAPMEALVKNYYGRILLIVNLVFYLFLGVFSLGYFNFLYGEIFEGFLLYPIRYTILPITFALAAAYCFVENGKYFVDIFGSFWCFIAILYGIISCLHI